MKTTYINKEELYDRFDKVASPIGTIFHIVAVHEFSDFDIIDVEDANGNRYNIRGDVFNSIFEEV